MPEKYACTRCIENYCTNCKNFRVNDDTECLICGAPVE